MLEPPQKALDAGGREVGSTNDGIDPHFGDGLRQGGRQTKKAPLAELGGCMILRLKVTKVEPNTMFGIDAKDH